MSRNAFLYMNTTDGRRRQPWVIRSTTVSDTIAPGPERPDPVSSGTGWGRSPWCAWWGAAAWQVSAPSKCRPLWSSTS